MDQCIVGQRLYQKQGVVHAAGEVAGKDRVADVAAPYRQSLTLTLLQVAAAHDRPTRVAGEHPPAGLHLVVDVDDSSEPPKPAVSFSSA